MKTKITLLLTVALMLVATTFLKAQSPEGINYQAVIRDGSGAILANSPVTLKFIIKETTAAGTTVFEEAKVLTTDEFGTVSTVIGSGVPTTGTLSGVNWGGDDHFLNVRADIGGGYIDLGTSTLESVPYAFFADMATSADSATNATNAINAQKIVGTQLNIYLGNTNIINFIKDCISTGNSFMRGDVWSCTNNFYWIDFFRGPNNVFRVAQDGSLTIAGSASKPGGGSWAATSDERLKQNINPFTDGLTKVLAIKPVRYQYNEKAGIMDTEKEYVGVIAQDLKEVAPYMVGTFEKDGTEYYNVDNSAMTYMLINAIKEQQAQIDALKLQIDALSK